MVWNFIGVHIINRTLHGHLEYKISLLVLKDIYPTVIQQSMNEAEYEERRVLSVEAVQCSDLYICMAN